MEHLSFRCSLIVLSPPPSFFFPRFATPIGRLRQWLSSLGARKEQRESNARATVAPRRNGTRGFPQGRNPNWASQVFPIQETGEARFGRLHHFETLAPKKTQLILAPSYPRPLAKSPPLLSTILPSPCHRTFPPFAVGKRPKVASSRSSMPQSATLPLR